MKQKIQITGSAIGTSLLLPVVALAQGDLSNVNTLIQAVGDIITTLIPIVFALILLAFFWGLAKYVLNADNEEARDQGKRIMIGGVIALFVAAAIWGIVNFLETALLGTDSEETVTPPGVNIQS